VGKERKSEKTIPLQRGVLSSIRKRRSDMNIKKGPWERSRVKNLSDFGKGKTRVRPLSFSGEENFQGGKRYQKKKAAQREKKLHRKNDMLLASRKIPNRLRGKEQKAKKGNHV